MSELAARFVREDFDGFLVSGFVERRGLGPTLAEGWRREMRRRARDAERPIRTRRSEGCVIAWDPRPQPPLSPEDMRRAADRLSRYIREAGGGSAS